MENSTVIAGDFTPLLRIVKRSRNKMSKDMEELNSIIN